MMKYVLSITSANGNTVKETLSASNDYDALLEAENFTDNARIKFNPDMLIEVLHGSRVVATALIECIKCNGPCKELH